MSPLITPVKAAHTRTAAFQGRLKKSTAKTRNSEEGIQTITMLVIMQVIPVALDFPLKIYHSANWHVLQCVQPGSSDQHHPLLLAIEKMAIKQPGKI